MNTSNISKSIIQSDYEHLRQKTFPNLVESHKFWNECMQKNYFDDFLFLDYFKDLGTKFWFGCIFLSSIPFGKLIDKYSEYLFDPKLLRLVKECDEDFFELEIKTMFLNGNPNFSIGKRKMMIRMFLKKIKHFTQIIVFHENKN